MMMMMMMLMMWLWRWWGLWYLLETLNHNFHDRMVSCAMGPGDVDIFSKPFRKPDDRMVNDSITSALLLDSFTTLHAVMYLQQHHYIMLALSHYIIVSLFRCILTESPRCCWILHVLLQKKTCFSPRWFPAVSQFVVPGKPPGRSMRQGDPCAWKVCIVYLDIQVKWALRFEVKVSNSKVRRAAVPIPLRSMWLKQ